MRWINIAAMWWLDIHKEPDYQRCMAYGGGDVCQGTVRVCKKRRWHTDSHAYGFWLRDDEGDL